MKTKKKLFMSLILALVMVGSISIASAETVVPFTVSNLGSSGFTTACTATAEGSQWRLYIGGATNYGVGQGFVSGTGTWATSLYTYNKNTTGYRPYKNYLAAAPDGTMIDWRMRADNDYTSLFSCYGSFRP